MNAENVHQKRLEPRAIHSHTLTVHCLPLHSGPVILVACPSARLNPPPLRRGSLITRPDTLKPNFRRCALGYNPPALRAVARGPRLINSFPVEKGRVLRPKVSGRFARCL